MSDIDASRHVHGRRRALALGGAVLAVGVAAGPSAGLAAVIPGTPGNDVTVGLDNDNARNTFLQPPGVAAVQHLDNTDVLFGRAGDDLLVGRAGSDVLVAGPGDDILLGGPDGSRRPGSDTALGDDGDDIAVWGPGDASETFVGDAGVDAQVVGRLRTRPGGAPLLTTYAGRKVPRVTVDAEPAGTCVLQRVPAGQRLGAQFLVRILNGRRLVATLRLKDVERVVCPSPAAGSARVADLTRPAPSFSTVRLSAVPGVLGAIVAPR